MEIQKFVDFINENKPFVFAKFGDGEYYAAIKSSGGNCDGTPYTEKLSDGINSSLKYLTEFDNTYIARWVHNGVDTYFRSITTNNINWTDYNIFIFKSIQQYFNEQDNFYKAIKNYKGQKIYICNGGMIERSKHLLNIDDHVEIDPVNWFETNYDYILTNVVNTVKDSENLMILSSAGMGAKVLIADLKRRYPNAFIIDIGSAMDLVFGGRRSRDFHYNFSDQHIQQIIDSLIT